MNAIDPSFWAGRTVLVTGDTGFKGSWLCEWLLRLGAHVHGAALPAPRGDGPPPLHTVLRLGARMPHHDVDLNDLAAVHAVVRAVRPTVVLHLAAQSLVRASYADPLGTFATNVMGTAHLLDALRMTPPPAGAPCAVVCVTSDKCYAHDGSGRPFTESDRCGGDDPYSASKGMAELLVHAYRQSFARPGAADFLRLATARAGNVIGGGDTAADRLVVDAVHALARGQSLAIRQPDSVRPWQHVLEPLAGYLQLAQHLLGGADGAQSGWNFGPGPRGERTVAELCAALVQAFGHGAWHLHGADPHRPEARTLRLATGKARRELGWRPLWSFADTVARTVDWYRTAFACGHEHERMTTLTQGQIAAYERAQARQRRRRTPEPTHGEPA